ncbi:MAG: sigma-70 family RNA polymerase sigma factor [Nitrospira sp.]|nr:sigma-70 family RNA polymerase sigma factor [Nitrospira sp.]
MKPTEHLSDNHLIDSIHHGDLQAFELLYDRYAGKVLKRCFFICLNEEQARDLMQEVWIKVFLNLHTFKKEAAFSSWLYRLTTNHCLNYLKTKARSEQPFPISPPTTTSPITQTIEVHTLLNKLSMEDRTLLALKFMGEYTYEEISAICEISVSAAKMRVSRLITKLREEINS